MIWEKYGWTEEYARSVWGRLVSMAQVTPNGCWIWQASCDNHGYPQIGGCVDTKRWGRKAHVVSWEMKNNVETPPGFRLVRDCDRKCINPDHARLGTTMDQTRAALAAQPRPTRESDVRRFMQFVEKQKTGCWLWIGARTGAGSYGSFWLDGDDMGAHRASHILFKGPLTRGQVVMHSCDDRQCVNPEHLSEGSHADNSNDMVRKGRSMAGERNTLANMTEETAKAILADHRHGVRGEANRLANKHNVGLGAVRALVGGKDLEASSTD